MADLRAMKTSTLIRVLAVPGEGADDVSSFADELDMRIPSRILPSRAPTKPDPTKPPPSLDLVDQLVILARRACREMPGKQMRIDFEADLVALLRENGREP